MRASLLTEASRVTAVLDGKVLSADVLPIKGNKRTRLRLLSESEGVLVVEAAAGLLRGGDEVLLLVVDIADNLVESLVELSEGSDLS